MKTTTIKLERNDSPLIVRMYKNGVVMLTTGDIDEVEMDLPEAIQMARFILENCDAVVQLRPKATK